VTFSTPTPVFVSRAALVLRTVTSQEPYQVAFDLFQKSFQWWFPAVGLILLLVGAVLIWVGRSKHWSLSRRFFAYFMVAFACIWSAFAFSTTSGEYASLRSGYRNGQFSVVEGQVTNFHPMPYEGHQEECFSVQAQTFCYSDYVITGGFNNTASHGGPIREGLPVRVSYIGNAIVRLEVRSDALPSVADRKAVTFAMQKDWQERQERDPRINRLNLGFSVAMVFMTAWWNLQPLRFIRLWLKPPYKPITVKLFRLFFAANLIGAISYFVRQVTGHQRTFADYRAAAEIAAAWIALVWVMITVALWFAHRQDQPKLS
jgi:hypothetical protein